MKIRMFFDNNLESGMTLVGSMISLGFIGLIAVGSMKLMSNQSNANKSLQNRQSRYALKRMLIGKVSCAESFEEESCNPGEVMELLDANEETVVAKTASGTKSGGFTLRAECNDRGDGIVVKAAHLKNGGSIHSSEKTNFRPDPLTKKRVTWDDDVTLVFGKNLSICPDINGTPSIYKSCRRKRSAIYEKDFVSWCPEKFPKLYACTQVASQANGSGEEDDYTPTRSSLC